jgi:aspartyl-tRNA(Asn)/glutamyl-tRNA(Gln) amidotransferase subunit C
MSLTPNDVHRLGRLSRLGLARADGSDATQATLQRLESVLELINQLSSADIEGVEPLTHPQDMILRLREDIVTETNLREQIQAVAPSVEDGLYLVPKVIE